MAACRPCRGVGAVEHRIVFGGLQVRRAFDRHCAANVHVGSLDLAFRKSDRGEQVEARRRNGLTIDAERVTDEIFAKGPLVEGELDVERGQQRLSTFAMASSVRPLAHQGRGVDAGRVGERAVADGVGLDLRDLAFAIAEHAQRAEVPPG